MQLCTACTISIESLQSRLNSAMSSLAADTDREVCAAALAINDAYKQVRQVHVHLYVHFLYYSPELITYSVMHERAHQ